MQSPITRYLESVLDDCRHLDGGAIAEGNAELERADPETFAVALATVGGSVYAAGDCDTEFSIQSISKALAYALAVEDNGLERMLEATDVEPSGDSFNEISLERATGRPRNPLINAGALAVHSMIRGSSAQERAERIRDLHSRCAGRQLSTNTSVYEAEIESDDRNTAIAYLLKSVGILAADPAEVVDGYARQCSVDVNCVDLATIASVMANGGVDPITGERLIDGAVNRHVLSVMSTCGMYDGSGSWVAAVGIPAKSGVAGAIVGVLPGQVGLAVLSPKLNEHGNSVRGVAVFERLSRDLELHMMHVAPSGTSAIREVTGEDATIVHLQGDLRFAGAESVLATLAEGIDAHHRITLDLNHVRAMDDVARRLLEDAAAGLREDGHDVDIDDPHGLMAVLELD
ncbi:glutaminase A [Rhodococcus sp. WWJCD1]|uniref:glutaminase A n=1 Tax=Rhodococcus sp. WWJCD1 TaxID=2022519 RepID=UPI000B9BA364|nr:glutaminase A [Rhodococcus sp. WWJCD1]OZC53255.1 glutaminase A [Rhodococcus sp. WWJCD1]